ncbi:CHAT domain-containing tetratricopeptide repeat protein [Amycolatopsis sp. Hca4]|uniref:CHAT domain-containing tetratricopeptide repeat protein n=1 Tax=Amycolatopsis sp. Hca4 TaxID=2742131 RepID=UPI0015917837|nr:CHAT domain-containing tetratricopeptide repeat protein [Amycolatopsis sp. Hca4]QKV73650.1 CHAT domain-containing protein [Amycolatopsis sp. Hca4]
MTVTSGSGDERLRAQSNLRRLLASVSDDDARERLISDESVSVALTVAETSQPHLKGDLEARILLGRWHFYRYQILPVEENQQDFYSALHLWAPLIQANPSAFPTAINRYASEAGLNELTMRAARSAALYEQAGLLPFLDNAVQLFRTVSDLTPPNHRDKGLSLSNLGNALRIRFERTENTNDIEEAVLASREAVVATPGDPDIGTYWDNLGVALQHMFASRQHVDDLIEAVESHRNAISATPDSHYAVSGRLSNLGGALLHLFRHSGDRSSLDQALEILPRAVQKSAPHELGRCLSNLGAALLARFKQTGLPADLEEAIDVKRRAVAATPEDSPELVPVLGNLINALWSGCDFTTPAADLDPHSALATESRLEELGLVLTRQYSITQAADIFNKFILTWTRLTSITTEERDEFRTRATVLADILITHYRLTGKLSELEDALHWRVRAYDSTPVDHPEYSVMASNRGSALQRRFDHSGNLTDLVDAISLHRQAVASTPRDDPQVARHSANLGIALVRWFENTPEQDVLDEAIDLLQTALKLTPPTDPSYRPLLSKLGVAHLRHYLRTGDGTMLDNAVEFARKAITNTETDDIGNHLNNLGTALSVRFLHTASPSDLDEAIDVGKQAVAATPTGDPRRRRRLSNLSSSLLRKFEDTGDVGHLDEAIAIARLATDGVSPFNAEFTSTMIVLADALKARFEFDQDDSALNECRERYASAAQATSGPVDQRILAARLAADVDLAADDAQHALSMAEHAVDLLGLVKSRRLRRSDRQHRISQSANLAATAATAAVLAGRPARAVELLEQTRGLLITDTIDTCGRLDELECHAPDLALEFSRLRDVVDVLDHCDREAENVASDTRPDRRPDSHSRQRQETIEQWDRLLTRIRAIPSLAKFLLPPPIEDLVKTASEGPVVYVFTHNIGSHALILRDLPEAPVEVIPLPKMTKHDAHQNIATLRGAITSGAHTPWTSGIRLRKVFAWMWDSLAGPVLAHLGYRSTPVDATWPRLWWCPVGELAHLPLHAAGHHPQTQELAESNVDAVIDRVVSSYTPTARALQHSRRPLSVTATSTLVVAVPDAPGTRRLNTVPTEVATVLRLIPEVTVLPAPGCEATRESVATNLATCDIAHFACHGEADWLDPAQGKLLLHDHIANPLTVQRLVALQLTKATLAYLSACDTTTVTTKHANEAIHLTGALQLAGFRSVVGTLWSIDDAAGAVVARTFYEHLTNYGTRRPEPGKVAHALHQALRAYRNSIPVYFDQWASYVHSGA